MITTKTFRAAEQMLLAANISSADALVTVIAAALETMSPTPFPEEARKPDSIVLRLATLAERLGWDHSAALDQMRRVNSAILAELGFSIGDGEILDNEASTEQPTVTSASTTVDITLSATFSAILRGTGLIPITADDRRVMTVDAGSSAVIELVSRIAVVGGALLYREAETADERVSELMTVAATIAAGTTFTGRVVVHDRSDAGRLRVPPTAALLEAVLHDANVLLTTDDLLMPQDGVHDSVADDEFNDINSKVTTSWRGLKPEAVSLSVFLPHVPIAVIVPISGDAVLSPGAATAFVTALGPLRRDRAAAGACLRDMAEDRLSDAVADRLVDLWDGRAERALTSLGAISRMIDDKPLPGSTRNDSRKRQASPDPHISEAYSAMAEVMVRGLAPHVWSPVTLQPKAKSPTFYRELFVCDPPAELLFSEQLRDEPGVRILLVGPPGTGKSAAASHIASTVLGMPNFDLKAADVLFHRLGSLERAITAAFRQARERSAVLIIDEADSLVQDRATASQSSLHLVTAITNTILIELDRHPMPVILATNFGDRIDPAVKRRLDFTFEVKPIPEDREIRALRLLLDLDPPDDFHGFGGDTVISDYAGAKRVLRIRGGGADAAVSAVRRARDVRLGRQGQGTRRIGF